MSKIATSDPLEGIAIIGMAGRFPGARNVGQFWENLKNGVESIRFFSEDELLAAGVDQALLRHAAYVRAAPVLDDIEGFDASFFGFSPREAELIDPQHRLFLECAWEACESAGYAPHTLSARTGVFAGAGASYYALANLGAMSSLQAFLGNEKDYLATRVAYKLDLKGPAIGVQTACSSALVAVHLACQNLLQFDCDLALAGGVNVRVPHLSGYLYQEEGIYSPDGHCRAFDAAGQGTVFGSGAGVVLLKRLAEAVADRDFIFAVIKGAAINNDGAAKAGYTTPSQDGQAEVIALAQALAGVEPETVTYIEAHGTGTPLGDPIELAALEEVFRERARKQHRCAIGSVKTNVGHLDAAAGIAGLVKTALAMHHRLLPPSLNFDTPNPRIDFAASPFYVNRALAAWETGDMPRRAGVSSFGIGGTNAHVVLEEAPPRAGSSQRRPCQLFVLSANTRTALDRATVELGEHLRTHPDLCPGDVSYTLQVGRRTADHRRILVCRDLEDAAQALETLDPKRLFTSVQPRKDRPVSFLFPGQGAQFPGMARELYQLEGSFRGQIDRSAELLLPLLGIDLRCLLDPRAEEAEAAGIRLDQTGLTQPVLFAVEHALARLLIGWGMRPAAMIGHSVGEYVAACLAEVFSLEDGLRLVAARARLMQTLPGGAMLATRLSEDEARTLLSGGLSLAAVNGPASTVFAGPVEEIAALESRLSAAGRPTRRLRTSHAFHSAAMDPILEAFAAEVRRVRLAPPKIPYVSNVTGRWIESSEAMDPLYWARHLRATVRFGDSLGELARAGLGVLFEVGPGKTLTALAKSSLADAAAIPAMRSREDKRTDLAVLLQAVGQLWLAGAAVDWAAVRSPERPGRVPLPTYPFERQRYWIEPASPAREAGTGHGAERRALADWFSLPTWQRSLAPRQAVAGSLAGGRRWLLFADPAGLGARLASRLTALGQDVTTVLPGGGFARLERKVFSLDPAAAEGYVSLLRELDRSGSLPEIVVHLWTVTPQTAPQLDPAAGSGQERLGFYSLLFLAQALGKQSPDAQVRLAVVSNGLHEVIGDEVLEVAKALVLGPCRVTPQEYPQISCSSIDVRLADFASAGEEASIDRLLAEILSQPAAAVVALRGGSRWLPAYESLRLEEGPANRTRLREGGVYLITGGLGGIGLVLAEHLARSVRARLVLAGRSSLPPREDWNARLASGLDERTGRRIRTLQRIEELGSDVLVASLDVSDAGQVQALVAEARRRFGAIHGVIHAAGVPGGGLIQGKSYEAAAAVLLPKVRGTLTLEAALRGEELDFFLLCSSTIGLTGGVGQVDYCAANSFVDAFARARSAAGGGFTVAIAWDRWEKVGMAVETNGESRPAAESDSRPAGHPFLGRLIADDGERSVYLTRFSAARHWMLDEHRVQGTAVVPGTAFLEMARAAAEAHSAGQTVELREVVFAAPLAVADGQEREARSILERGPQGLSFRVLSRPVSPPGARAEWQEHVTARVAYRPPAEPAVWSLGELRRRCSASTQVPPVLFPDRESSFVYWGPRWAVLKEVHTGEREALALLELPPQFVTDLEGLGLHPALLDVAVAFAAAAAGEGLYLPLLYGRLTIARKLPVRFYSYLKFKGDGAAGGPLRSFDVVLLDEEGAELVRVDDFTLKRVEPDAAPAVAGRSGNRSLDEAVPPAGRRRDADGIFPEEGIEVLRHLLAREVPAQVVVSTLPITARIAASTASSSRALQPAEGSQPGAVAHPRPDLQTSYVEPRGDLEGALAALWQELLGIERAGAHDDFFDLGGHSLLGIQLVSQIRERLGVELPLGQIFEAPTIAQLAERIAALRDSQDAPRVPAIARVSRAGDLPLSFSQQSLWILHQVDPESPAYNLSISLRFGEGLVPAVLERSCAELFRRQEVLRTTIVAREGRPTLVISPPGAFRLPVVALDGLPPALAQDLAERLAAEETRRPFDLARGPLCRIHLLSLGREDHVVVINIHHVIADGWSMGLLIQEVAAIYEAYARGEASPLPEPLIQYADYASWQREWLQGENLERQMNFWREALAGAPPTLELPTDRPRSPSRGARGARRWKILPTSLVDAVTTAGRREGATLFMTLLAALKIVLFRWSGQRDLVVGTVLANRTRAEVESLIGCFVNFLPIRSKIEEDQPGLAVLEGIRRFLLAASSFQECPFEKIVEAVNPLRSPGQSPLYNVAFLLQNYPQRSAFAERIAAGSTWAADGAAAPPQAATALIETQGAALDLRFVAEEVSGGISFWCEYDRDLFAGETIDHLLDDYMATLRRLTEDPQTPVSGFAIHEASKRRERRGTPASQPGASTPLAEPEIELVSQWQAIYEETYSQPVAPGDEMLDVVSWQSSYTGLPIPEEEMREWVERTAERILTLRPRRVLEIGCGTGLLLLRVAPSCSLYVGTDFSSAVLERLRRRLDQPGRELPHVTLLHRMADRFEGIEDGTFDLVVLNSVVQCFPSLHYLMDVLAKAVHAVAPGGAIFLGDVRNLSLLRGFHASVEFHRALDSLPVEQLDERVRTRAAFEKELVIDPSFFTALRQRLPRVRHAQVLSKRGHYQNEMVRFRYDVVLRVGEADDPPPALSWLDWQEEGLTLEALRKLLCREAPDSLGLSRVPNARVRESVRALDLLARAGKGTTAETLRVAVRAGDAGVDPEALWSLAEELGYAAAVGCPGGDGCCTVLLRKRTAGEEHGVGPLFPTPLTVQASWRHYANDPLHGASIREPSSGVSPAAARTIPPLHALAWQGDPPLSLAQEGLWQRAQGQTVEAVPNVAAAFRVTGDLALPVLERSFQEVVRRHAPLRNTFLLVRGEPRQVVVPTQLWTMPVLDLRALPSRTRESEAERLIRDEVREPCDLSRGPLLRASLLALAERSWIAVIRMPPIAGDRRSMEVLTGEVVTHYSAFVHDFPSPLRELPVEYADFAVWQRQWLCGEVLEERLRFWRNELADAPAALELPTDRPCPPLRSYQGGSQPFTAMAAVAESLRGLARERKTTLFVVLLSAFQALLHRYTGQEDVLVGSLAVNRDAEELADLIGPFSNPVALRGRFRQRGASWRELVDQVGGTVAAAHAHGDLPFERLIDELGVKRSPSRSPLFQVMLILQTRPQDALSSPELALEPLPLAAPATRFDLTLDLAEWSEGLAGALEYSRELFDASTAQRLLGHLGVLLEGLAAEPGRRLADLPLLTEPERHQLWMWNATGVDYPQGLCLHERIEAQAARTPQAVAVVFAGESITYGELNRRANLLARRLRSLGVGPEVLVGICSERSAEMVVGLLAVLKAGAAYVPLDPGYPASRLALMLEDAQVPVLLAQGRVADRLPSIGLASRLLLLDDSSKELEEGSPDANLPNEAGSEHAAYAIFTSGSTGRPKGVVNTHRGIVNRLLWMQEAFGLTTADRVLQKTPFSFDVSVWEFFWPLMTGARLVVARPGGHQDPDYLIETIAQEGITTLHFVPSMFQVFLDAKGLERCAGLRQVIASGEALPAELSRRFANRLGEPFGVALHNLYGPTEAAVDVTFHTCRAGEERAPIGRPIANTQIHLLDPEGEPVPVGVPGELYIGGIQVARGYLRRPELTAERFLPDPFGELGRRLYRTGDLARRLPDGEIEFLGRIDQQVKIRGFRIELGEIEAVLHQDSAVRQAVVLAGERTPGEPWLVAFFVAAGPQPPTPEELRDALRAKLPETMVPQQFVCLPEIPLSPNGKVDRRELAGIYAEQVTVRADVERQAVTAAPGGGTGPAGKGSPPRTPTEELLAAIWSQVLNRQEIGPRDDFFELGGHSILGVQMLWRVQETFQVSLRLRSLFDHSTLTALTTEIDKAVQTGEGLEYPPIGPARRDRALPLSFAQERLWFIDQLAPGNPLYNLPAAFRIQGTLDVGALCATLTAVVRRHESLRTNFVSLDGRPAQVIAPASPVALPAVDLRGLAAESREAEVLRLAAEETKRSFDLARDALLRVTLLQTGEREHVLLFTMHHIVSDGWSIGVLVREVSTLYAVSSRGLRSPLPELPVQYADFACWQREWLQGEVLDRLVAYWRQRLAGAQPSLRLPMRPRPPAASDHGGRQTFRVPGPVASALRDLSRQEKVTLFMTLLAAFDSLLYRYTGQTDVLVGTDIANRRLRETEAMIGFFVNLLVLRSDLSGMPTIREMLGRVREVCLGAFAHQDLPFAKLVEELRPDRSNAASPLFDVLFVLQNAPEETLDLEASDLKLSPVPAGTPRSRFNLALFLHEYQGEIHCGCVYGTDLFEPDFVARLCSSFQHLLASLAAHPDARLDELELIAEAERQEVIMQAKRDEQESFARFKKARPKPVALAQEELVKSGFLNGEPGMPLVFEPAAPEIDLVDWAAAHRDAIERDLFKYGAILFRGFDLKSAQDFERFASCLCPDLFGEYGDLPREEVSARVYTSTPYPPDKTILFHNESSHLHRWPLKQLFFCVKPAEKGGETPIVDCRKVYADLAPGVRELFAAKGLMYVRNFTDGLDVSWRDFFATDDRSKVKEICSSSGLGCEWRDGDGLRTTRVAPAVAKHPRTGDLIFFNQVQLHHMAALEPEVRSSLLSLFGEEALPRSAYFGDGTAIPDEVIAEILRVYWRNAVSFPWQQSDVLLLDNMLTAHARNPYEGSRKILVAMGEMFSEDRP
ncbi:MAG TPA: amino acid adenylation domain-containing protein [Thermoanaerobaculia bacterium]|nr:amino acid adenylation domain-containing protein [Thermoanaerobaculia bacterium]